MPIITALTPARRRPHHICVEIDGTPLATLHERDVAAHGLAVGQPVDDATREELEQVGGLSAALGLANRFLAHRPRTAAEVRQRLQQSGFDPQTIDSAVERLTAVGLLDDRRFADLWVENRSTFSPRSARALEVELRRKGIDRETVEATIAETGPLDETASAVDAGRRRLRAFSTQDEQTFRKRMAGFLARRGYGYEAVAAAVDALWSELASDR